MIICGFETSSDTKELATISNILLFLQDVRVKGLPLRTGMYTSFLGQGELGLFSQTQSFRSATRRASVRGELCPAMEKKAQAQLPLSNGVW